jgi:L-lactate dehydrogenase complex protein LldE
MIRDHYPKVAAKSGDPAFIEAVAVMLPRVYEFCELLVDRLGVTDVGAMFAHTVTYHSSCHSLRSLGLRDQPLKLLQAVRGLDLRLLQGADECCGFGGTFSVKNPDVSTAMLGD